MRSERYRVDDRLHDMDPGGEAPGWNALCMCLWLLHPGAMPRILNHEATHHLAAHARTFTGDNMNEAAVPLLLE